MAPAARREAVTGLAGHAVGLAYADAPQQYAPPPADGDAAHLGDVAEGDDALSGGAPPSVYALVRVLMALSRGRRCDAFLCGCC